MREIFRRFWPYARPYRRWLALSLVLIALVPLDRYRDDLDVQGGRRRGPGPAGLRPLRLDRAAYVGLTLLAGVLGFADDYLANWIGERFLLDLRTRFFAHLQGLSLDFFDRRRLGDLISRLTGDIASIEAFVLSGVTDAISYLLRIVFFSAALFYLQWDLALVSLLVAPLFWLARSGSPA